MILKMYDQLICSLQMNDIFMIEKCQQYLIRVSDV